MWFSWQRASNFYKYSIRLDAFHFLKLMNRFGGIPKIKMLSFFPPTFFFKKKYLQAEKVGEAQRPQWLRDRRQDIMHGRNIFLRVLATNMADSRWKPKCSEVGKEWIITKALVEGWDPKLLLRDVSPSCGTFMIPWMVLTTVDRGSRVPGRTNPVAAWSQGLGTWFCLYHSLWSPPAQVASCSRRYSVPPLALSPLSHQIRDKRDRRDNVPCYSSHK